MSQANTYYFDQLNKDQKRAYYAMYNGLKNLETSFAVPRLTSREMADIYFMIRLDHPEIFYSIKFNYRYYQDSESVEFSPEYLFPRKQIKEHQQAMASRIRKLVRQAAERKTDTEKELFIHDFICSNVTYDKLKKPYSHEIIGPLGHGVSVCEGIAKAVKILCDELQIWCIVALCDNNPEKGIKYRHTWNVIRIGGHYYHLDVTFDNTLTRGHGSNIAAELPIRYDYFNLSDSHIFKDHEPAIYRLPVCGDSDHSYYREKKISFTRMEDVRKRAVQALRKKKPLLFHWRGGYLTREVLREMLLLLREEAGKKEKAVHVSVNWPQAVVLVQFTDLLEGITEESEPSVVMEEANEGELVEEEEKEPERVATQKNMENK